MTEHMSHPEESIPLILKIGRKWYLEEKPNWDPKTKLAAQHMRRLYEWYYLKTPEEKAKEEEKFRQLIEEAKAHGAKVYEGWDDEEELDESGSILV